MRDKVIKNSTEKSLSERDKALKRASEIFEIRVIENFKTRNEVDDYILKNEAIKYMIAEDGIKIETEKGVTTK